LFVEDNRYKRETAREFVPEAVERELKRREKARPPR
jgi:hypothetical protein